jgi:hypothetical protein
MSILPPNLIAALNEAPEDQRVLTARRMIGELQELHQQAVAEITAAAGHGELARPMAGPPSFDDMPVGQVIAGLEFQIHHATEIARILKQWALPSSAELLGVMKITGDIPADHVAELDAHTRALGWTA